MPPNLPQCGHFSSNKPDGCNGPFPYPLLGVPAVGFKAPECSSRGSRRGVSTVPRSLQAAVQVTFLHHRRWAYTRWAYLTSIWFFCQAENFCGSAKNFSGILCMISQAAVCPPVKNIFRRIGGPLRRRDGGVKIRAAGEQILVGCSDFYFLPVFCVRAFRPLVLWRNL